MYYVSWRLYCTGNVCYNYQNNFHKNARFCHLLVRSYFTFAIDVSLKTGSSALAETRGNAAAANYWMMSNRKGKTHRIPPLGHTTAWRPLNLGRFYFAQKILWSVVIKRRRNGLLVCYGLISIKRCFAMLRFQYPRQYEASKLRMTQSRQVLSVVART